MNDIADLSALLYLGGVFKAYLLQIILDLFGGLYNGLLCIAGIVKGIAVNFNLHVLSLAEVALAGCHEGIFNCLKQCFAADVLLFFQGEDRLFQLSVHAVSFIHSKSNASRMDAISLRPTVSLCLPD